MVTDYQAVLIITLFVSLLSIIIVFFRAASFDTPENIENKGIGSVRKQLVVFYGLFMPSLASVISYVIYSSMLTKAPQNAPGTFLLISLGLAVFLTILASNILKMKSVVELFALHAIYALGFGWLMPMILAL